MQDTDLEPALSKAAKEALIRVGKPVVPALIAKLSEFLKACEAMPSRCLDSDARSPAGEKGSSTIPALTALENDPDLGIAALNSERFFIQPR